MQGIAFGGKNLDGKRVGGEGMWRWGGVCVCVCVCKGEAEKGQKGRKEGRWSEKRQRRINWFDS